MAPPRTLKFIFLLIVMALDVVAKLLMRIQELNKKPSIDMALNEALDSFMGVLNEKQDYLRNGIVNVDFPEAALFVEYAASVFGKEVDILWQNSLQFHMHLCAQNKTPENVEETNRIIERINQRKRKKITLQNTDISRHLNQDLTTMINQASQVIKKGESLQNSNEVNNLWKAANLLQKDSSQNSSRTNTDVRTRPTMDFRLPLNENVNEINTNEKLSNYDDLMCTSALLHLDEMDVDSARSTCSGDDLLQKYLNSKRLTYEKYCQDKCGSDFEHFRRTYRSLGEEEVVSRQVEGLCPNVTEYNNNSIVTNAQKSSRAASECVSDVDSLFHEVECSNDGFQNTRISHTRRSMTDSGIYCDGNISDGTHIEEDLQDNGSVIKSLTLQECTTPSVERSCGAYIDQVAQEAIRHVVQEAVLNEEGDLVAFLVHNVEVERPRRIRKRKFEEEEGEASEDEEEEEIIEITRRPKKAKFKLKPRCTVDFQEFEIFFRRTYRSLFDDDYVSESSDDEVFDESYENTPPDHHSTPIRQCNDALPSASQDSGIELSQFDETDVVPSVSLPDGIVPSDTLLDSAVSSDPPLDSVSVPIQNSIISEPTVRITTQIPSKETGSRLVINEWSKFIQPKLIEAENNLNFDIHEYGTKIMDSVPENEAMQFKNIVSGRKASEVARYFLATLQLANTNNIDIIQPQKFELANDTMQIKLLTRERYHEHLSSFAAPSESDVREKLARVEALRPSTSSGLGKSRASNCLKVKKRIFH